MLQAVPSRAQEELTRKAKSKVAPTYPELAKRMSIAGVVKVQVVVAPNGSVKTTKVVGGHPLLRKPPEWWNSSLIRTRAISKRILLRCSRLSASGAGVGWRSSDDAGQETLFELWRCASRSRLFVHRQLDGRPAGDRKS